MIWNFFSAGVSASIDGLQGAGPLLKEWLDARLPELVETLVSREIARITGKSL